MFLLRFAAELTVPACTLRGGRDCEAATAGRCLPLLREVDMTIGSGGSFCKANNWGEVNAFAVRPYASCCRFLPQLAPSNAVVSPLFSGQPSLSSVPRIGNNVWIGVGVTVLKGVANRANAVIGGGVIVIRDVASGERSPVRWRSCPSARSTVPLGRGDGNPRPALRARRRFEVPLTFCYSEFNGD
jgi:hypothetical protein